MITVLAACSGNAGGATTASSSDAQSGNGLIIEVNAPTSVISFGSIEMGGAAAAKALGFQYQYSAPADLSNLQADESTLIREAISRHPAAIVVGNFIPSAFDPLIKQATRAGIPVVVVDGGEPTYKADGALTYVGYSYVYNGQVSADEALNQGVHHLLCVNGVPSNPDLNTECNSAAATMAAAGGSGAQLTAPASDFSNPTAVQQDIQGFLSSHPTFNGVYLLGANWDASAVAAVKDLGRSGQVKIGNNDISNQVLSYIKNGSISWAVDKQAYIEGFYAVQVAAQYVLYGLAPTQPIYTGGQIIDRNNVDQVIAVQKKYPGLRGAE
jgi:simple sugar transport system substrate-binding protein